MLAPTAFLPQLQISADQEPVPGDLNRGERETMPIRAAVMTAPNDPIELWELDDPVMEPGAVLLETIASEVCGTDVHLHHGRLAGVPYPIIPGHVSVGRVVEANGVDSDAMGDPLAPGDVAAPAARSTGSPTRPTTAPWGVGRRRST